MTRGDHFRPMRTSHQGHFWPDPRVKHNKSHARFLAMAVHEGDVERDGAIILFSLERVHERCAGPQPGSTGGRI